jgi:hypothetical protein
VNYDGISQQEREQIETVLRIAEDIGYGNLICRLQEAWGEMLRDKWNVGDGSPHKWGGHATDSEEVSK